MSDDEIRAEWKSAGGRMYGPNVETVAMPETDYFTFRRNFRVSDEALACVEALRDAANNRTIVTTAEARALVAAFDATQEK